MRQLIYIAQGENHVSADADVIINTILGSCISVCLWDPTAGVGGMNHLLLPSVCTGSNPLDTNGAVAMDRLINQMVHLGARRSALRAKLFGGSSMLQGRTDIGQRNAEFGRTYLKTEGIPCDALNVGGTKARNLRYFPAIGKAQLKLVDEAPVLVPLKQERANDVELF